MGATSFFEVAQPIERDIFLSITREVLESSLLIMSPFGLPRKLRQAVGSEALFVRQYGPRFRFILEAVSELVYAQRGVSESEVAVALHKYTEEDQDPVAIACLGRMSDALRLVYSPPHIVELPHVLPVGDLVSIGLSMLHAEAIYAPGARKARHGVPGVGGPPQIAGSKPDRDRDGSSIGTGTGVRGPAEDNAAPRCVTCQARYASAVFSRRLQTVAAPDADTGDDAEPRTPLRSVSSAQRGVGTADYERAQRAKVASCWVAMNNLRQETETFSQDLEQAHFQALAEAYAARYSGGSTAVSCACTYPTEGNCPSREESSHRLDVAALDEIAAVPFMDNELFVCIRELEQLHQQEGVEDSNADDIEFPNDETYHEAETSLEAVYTSQAYRILAEQSMDKGLTQEAAVQFEEAYREGSSYLPDRYLAELLAGRAKCYLQKRDFDAANVQAEAALAIHGGCGDAFVVRGQCRRELGDNQGALSDLVNAFVLKGSALDGASDGGEAQAIEDVSREACKSKAGEAFSLREPTNTLPADWVVRSFLVSYNTEDLYAEHEREASHRQQNSPEEPDGESAFWQGVHLVREGRYAEGMVSLSAALETEDIRLQSLALETYGSFLYLTGDMDGSLDLFRQAAEADATNAKSWVKKGSVLSDLGRREEAFECFDAATGINPFDSDLFLHRGQAHLIANDFRKAAADLQKSTELCSTMAVAWAAWGVALFKLGMADGQSSPSSVAKCLQVMEDALGRFPDSPEVLLFFAEILVSMGDFARGLELLKRSAVLDPECPLPYANAARAYLGMNDLVAARRHLEQGQSLDPSYAGTFMDMGQLLMQEGQPAEALSMYANGVDNARFPSEIHDAMACLDVARCHVEAQQLLQNDAVC